MLTLISVYTFEYFLCELNNCSFVVSDTLNFDTTGGSEANDPKLDLGVRIPDIETVNTFVANVECGIEHS